MVSTFQTVQEYLVTAEADIDEFQFVRECNILHDRTKIYRFSKELLAYVEMYCFFSIVVHTTGKTTLALPAPSTRTTLMRSQSTQPFRTRTSTPTWRDYFMHGTRGSSRPPMQQMPVPGRVRRLTWCRLKAEKMPSLLRKRGTACCRPGRQSCSCARFAAG